MQISSPSTRLGRSSCPASRLCSSHVARLDVGRRYNGVVVTTQQQSVVVQQKRYKRAASIPAIFLVLIGPLSVKKVSELGQISVR
jgi:hypothetical protein